MSSTKRFGGMDLAQIAATTNAGATGAAGSKPAAGAGPRPSGTIPIGEAALRGTAVAQHERVTVHAVDPKRCKPWEFHNRHASWYTRERCNDVIESISKDGQQVPAVGRRLQGDPNFDYEVIFGMRRRFACEFLNRPLKLEVRSIENQQAAILMHIENADRQDISAMERAISFTKQLRAGVFQSQDQMAEALQVTKGMVSKMVKAAELFDSDVIAKLFPDPTVVPVTPAYQVATQMADQSSREAILSAARYLAKKTPDALAASPAALLKLLISAPERSTRAAPLRKPYNVGKSGRMEVTRNARGKVTFAFRDGISSAMEEDVMDAVRRALKDLG